MSAAASDARGNVLPTLQNKSQYQAHEVQLPTTTTQGGGSLKEPKVDMNSGAATNTLPTLASMVTFKDNGTPWGYRHNFINIDPANCSVFSDGLRKAAEETTELMLMRVLSSYPISSQALT